MGGLPVGGSLFIYGLPMEITICKLSCEIIPISIFIIGNFTDLCKHEFRLDECCVALDVGLVGCGR